MKLLTPNHRTIARLAKLKKKPEPLSAYLPQFNEQLGRWIKPKYSRRVQANMRKLAVQLGYDAPAISSSNTTSSPSSVIFQKTVHPPLGVDGKVVPSHLPSGNLSPFHSMVKVNSLGIPMHSKNEMNWNQPAVARHEKRKLQREEKISTSMESMEEKLEKWRQEKLDEKKKKTPTVPF